MKNSIESALKEYEEKKHILNRFLNAVVVAFKMEPELNKQPFPLIHTIKYRMKDPSHLADKIERMGTRYNNELGLMGNVTDLAGVRVLHLHQDDLPSIHNFIMNMIKTKEWRLVEKPVAYSWDPELDSFFKDLSLKVKIKDSHYTSIHYLVAPPNADTKITCEIQVRTLFEEIWGEIDHAINYPHKTKHIPTQEQLRVLSKLVSTGSRLATSIYRTHSASSTESNEIEKTYSTTS